MQRLRCARVCSTRVSPNTILLSTHRQPFQNASLPTHTSLIRFNFQRVIIVLGRRVVTHAVPLLSRLTVRTTIIAAVINFTRFEFYDSSDSVFRYVFTVRGQANVNQLTIRTPITPSYASGPVPAVVFSSHLVFILILASPTK